MIRFLILWGIRIYQKTLSPDHGLLRVLYPRGFCRFYPSCSEYGYQAVEKYGGLKGGIMAIRRVFRCQPWSKGGNDPVN